MGAAATRAMGHCVRRGAGSCPGGSFWTRGNAADQPIDNAFGRLVRQAGIRGLPSGRTLRTSPTCPLCNICLLPCQPHPSYPLPLVLSRNVTIRGQPDRWAALSFGYVQR